MVDEPEDDEWDDEDDVDPIYLTDRSTKEVDDKCGMRRWWYKHEGGTGIIPLIESDHLRVGKDIHDDLAQVASWADLSATSEELAGRVGKILASLPLNPSTKLLEETYRRIGWLVAFTLYAEPRVRAEFDNVSQERECILDREPLWVAYTPDRILRHKEHHRLVYKEYKTTITANGKWIASWTHKPQLHIGIAGTQEEYGEKVAYAQVMGLMKGDNRDGRLVHPYVWGYYNRSTGKWTHDYQRARGKDWEHMPVWEFPEGPIAWVVNAGVETGLSQFPHSVPVMLNERLLADWIARVTAREETISEVEEDCRLDWDTRIIHFEPRTDQCTPAFGDPCPYRLCCHNAAVRENPLAHPDYLPRVPHHDVEVVFNSGDI